MRVQSFIAMGAFCCAVALSVVAVHAREVSGVSMPEVVSVAGRELRLNGIDVFKEKTFFKVYVVGLYLEKQTSDARVAITTDEAKRIVLRMLRDVSREMFLQAVETDIMPTPARRCQPCARNSIYWNRPCRPSRKAMSLISHTCRGSGHWCAARTGR